MALFIRFFLAGLLIIWTPFLRADWMNLTGAETAQNIVEIYVLDDHVKVKLEVYIGDLDKFEELIPDEWFKDSASERPSLEQRMQAFATRRLQFVTGKGVTLPARLELVEARERVDRAGSGVARRARGGPVRVDRRRRRGDGPRGGQDRARPGASRALRRVVSRLRAGLRGTQQQRCLWLVGSHPGMWERELN